MSRTLYQALTRTAVGASLAGFAISSAAAAGATTVPADATLPVATASTDATAPTVVDKICRLPGFGPGDEYHPRIDPKNFTSNVTNPWFPLTPGTTFVYNGTKDGVRAVNVVTASSQTKLVDGVVNRVVEDRLYVDGILRERTADYYAQDKCGNVWYFGEDTAELNRDGEVISTEGSFHAGIDGAQPGVYMQATPELGRSFRQEWYEGHAEDVFKAIDLDAKVSVPYGEFQHALRTEETTALEPGVRDNKYFVRGIGQVEELAVRGPVEKLVLVDVLSEPW